MLLNIAKVLIVYTCGSQSIFIVVPEENRIAEMFRNTLNNDQNSSRLMKSSSKSRKISCTFYVYLHDVDTIRKAIHNPFQNGILH